jgi:hypothetical protein
MQSQGLTAPFRVADHRHANENEVMGERMYAKTLMGTVITIATLSAAVAAERQIATVARITGNAVVSKGAQYVPGTEGMALTVGQRVMSLADSTVVIQFNDGCRYTLEENKLVTMEDVSPCVLTKGVALAPPPPSSVVPAVVAAPVAAAANLAWVPLAAVGAVAVAGAVADTGDDGNVVPTPISP